MRPAFYDFGRAYPTAGFLGNAAGIFGLRNEPVRQIRRAVLEFDDHPFDCTGSLKLWRALHYCFRGRVRR